MKRTLHVSLKIWILCSCHENINSYLLATVCDRVLSSLYVCMVKVLITLQLIFPYRFSRNSTDVWITVFYILIFMSNILCLETCVREQDSLLQFKVFSNYGAILYKGSITRALTKKKHEWSYERCSNNNKDLLKPHSEDSKQKSSGTINTIICQVTETNIAS